MRNPGVEGELVSLLTVMLAQAINQQDRSAAAQLRETLRCLSQFDQVGFGDCVIVDDDGHESYLGGLCQASKELEGRV